MEASINEIHRGLQSGKLTCRSLVQQYLDRIKAYDSMTPAGSLHCGQIFIIISDSNPK